MKKFATIIMLLVITMGMTSCSYTWSTEKKQAYAFTLLIREFYKHPEKMKKVEFSAEKDGKVIEVKDVKTLENWSNLDFLSITFPGKYFKKDFIFLEERFPNSTFSTTYLKYSDGTTDFFSKVDNIENRQRWTRSWTSFPYYMYKGLPQISSDEVIAQSNLEAIKVARDIISDM